MRYHYDAASDALFIRFREGEYEESEEIYDGFVIDFDKSGRPLGIDIYSDASKFVDLARLLRNFKQENTTEFAPMYVRDAPLDKDKH